MYLIPPGTGLGIPELDGILDMLRDLFEMGGIRL